jgi:3-deoxy-D-arabino-heptulosonate 7-phosphate (DAHP) synthase
MNERGQVTAFVVIFVVALIFIAGLVIDGGVGLAAKRRAMNEAQAAARAGAQALDTAAYRRGATSQLDPGQARQAALDYLGRTGHQAGAEVQVTVDTVTVDETLEQRLNILGVAGMRSISVSGHGSARTVHGVVAEGN